MLQYFMNNKIQIIDKKKFINFKKIIMISYSLFCLIFLCISIKIGNVKFMAAAGLVCLVSPIINQIIKYVFNNMQIIYSLNTITHINNPLNETAFIIDITELQTNKILTICTQDKLLQSQRTYISIEYKFEPHKYIFTNVSKFLKKQSIQQRTYYHPRSLSIKVHKNSKIIYQSDISKYQHLLDKDNQYAVTIQSIIIPAINNVIQFAINN